MGFSIPWRKCWRVSRQKLPLQSSVRTQRVDCTQAADVFLLNFKATRPKESLARFPNTMQMILNYSENKLLNPPYGEWFMTRKRRPALELH